MTGARVQMLASMRTSGQGKTRKCCVAIAAGFRHCQLKSSGVDVAQKKVIVPRSHSHRIAACLGTAASPEGLAPNSFTRPKGRPQLANLTVQWLSR